MELHEQSFISHTECSSLFKVLDITRCNYEKKTNHIPEEGQVLLLDLITLIVHFFVV